MYSIKSACPFGLINALSFAISFRDSCWPPWNLWEWKAPRAHSCRGIRRWVLAVRPVANKFVAGTVPTARDYCVYLFSGRFLLWKCRWMCEFILNCLCENCLECKGFFICSVVRYCIGYAHKFCGGRHNVISIWCVIIPQAVDISCRISQCKFYSDNYTVKIKRKCFVVWRYVQLGLPNTTAAIHTNATLYCRQKPRASRLPDGRFRGGLSRQRFSEVMICMCIYVFGYKQT